LAKISLQTPIRRVPLPAPAMAPVPAPRKARARGSRRYGKMRALTGRLLVLLVVVSAVPLASNRPAWWLIWVFLLGFGTAAYMVRAHMLMAGRPLCSAAFKGVFALALLVPGFALVQALPWAAHLPQAVQALPDLIDVARPASLSVMPRASLLGAIRAVGFILFLILVIESASSPDRARKLGQWLMIGILAHGLFGLIALRVLDDYALWGIKEAYQGMLTGTFANRNSVATFLGFGLVLAVAIAVSRPAGRLNAAYFWAAVAVLALAILLTQSRMGALATALGAAVTFVAGRREQGVGMTAIMRQLGVGLLVLLAALIPLAGTGMVERGLFTLTESWERTSLYAQIWGMIWTRPLTGFGYDAFAPAFEMFRAAPLTTDRYIDLAHNTYLALWVEQGLIVGSIPMVLIGWAALVIVRRLRAGVGGGAMTAAGLGVIVLGATHALVDFSLEIPANVFCFLLIIGLAIAPHRRLADSDRA
jgi:O-antigen ligase